MSLTLPSSYESASKNSNIKENWAFQLFNSNSYLQFDGTDDYINLGTTTASSAINLKGTSESGGTGISVSFFVNFPELEGRENIFASNSTATYSGYWIEKNPDDKIALNWGDDTGAGSSDRRTMIGSTVLSANTWYHVLITSTFANATSGTQIYINNVAETITDSGSASVTTPTYVSDGKAYIGREDFTATNYGGKLYLKNLAIWSGVLDSNNRTAIYNSGNYKSLLYDFGNYAQSSNLKGYWELNNGEPFIQDLSGNLQNGTINGATYKGFLPLSTTDTSIDDIFYHGVITNTGSIRDSIDLENSKAKTSNLSVNISNFNYKGSDMSTELLFGTYDYFNYNVRVYSQLNDDSSLSNCLQIYQGRLINIQHNDSSLSLEITEKKPWDFLSLPLNKTNTNKTYIPIVYGNYTPETSTVSSPDFVESANLFPVPVDRVQNNEFVCIAHKSILSDGRLHYFEKNASNNNVQVFTPVDDAQNASVSYDGANALKTHFDLHRNSKIKVIDIDASEDYAQFDDLGAKSVDGIITNFSTLDENDFGTTTGTGTGNKGASLDFSYDVPQFPHEIQSMKVGVFVKYTLTASFVSGGTSQVAFAISDNANNFSEIRNETLSYTFNSPSFSSPTTLTGQSSTGGGIISGSSANPTLQITNSSITEYISGDKLAGLDGQLPNKLTIRISCLANQSSSGGQVASFDINVQVASIYVIPELKIPVSTDTVAGQAQIANESIDKIEYLYSGADGFNSLYDGDSTLIEHGHEALRDILVRFAGTNNETPDGWADDGSIHGLHTDRHNDNWKIRYWQLEPKDLQSILDKITYEFGFIFKYRADGSSRVIYIKQSSELSASKTLNNRDIKNISVKSTSFTNLLTKMNINYQKHPAKNSYLSNLESSNNESRSKYNIKKNENIKEIKLDMNVGTPATTAQTDPNSDFYSYYNNIVGDVKKLISCEVVNSAKSYSMETGDIIKFDDMPVNPFGHTWSQSGSQYYMITNLQRGIGSVKIECREVG